MENEQQRYGDYTLDAWIKYINGEYVRVNPQTATIQIYKDDRPIEESEILAHHEALKRADNIAEENGLIFSEVISREEMRGIFRMLSMFYRVEYDPPHTNERWRDFLQDFSDNTALQEKFKKNFKEFELNSRLEKSIGIDKF